jgi:RNA polymerase sigma-70 factor (ECF subfamily)
LRDADGNPITLAQEREVVDRLKSGDREAAGQLYAWFGEMLYRQVILPRLPVPELAEDVLKDTFRRLLENIEQFEVKDRSTWFWLRRIAINRAMDMHRRHRRDRAIEERVDPDAILAPGPPRPDQSTHQAELRTQVDQSLGQLNPRYAQALRLRLLEDRDRADCAELMGVTMGNFDVILHRACAAFRKVFPP